MRQFMVRSSYILFVLTCAIVVVSCSWFSGDNTAQSHNHPQPVATVNVHPTIHSIEVDLLNNIKTNGFNHDPNINHGLGGLLINWRYGTHPLETNINGTGETDQVSGKPLRHDDLTDLRYIHNLWSYKVQNPDDPDFQGEIERFTPIIKSEFTNSHNERGWLFDEFVDLYHLSHDEFYKETALSLVKAYSKSFNEKIGSIYKVSSSHDQGSYRPNLVLESGCAMIQAGTLFSDQTDAQKWLQQGLSTVNFVYAHAYVPQFHTFPDQVDNVLNQDGSVNRQEHFFLGRTKNYTVYGRHMQMGNISQIIVSLLHTYQATKNQDFLRKATDLLDPLSASTNALGMWDDTYGGYYFTLNFTGASPMQPGGITVEKTRKEAGRQAIMLLTFHLANKFTNNRYKEMEEKMLDVAVQHIYVPASHGVLYLVNVDWTPQTFKNGTLNDMVTTEAMGAELESLFALND